MFFDEPTSGLDSFMAKNMVDCMRKMALKGKTIVCTIHQPSSDIFKKFGKLCLLAEGKLAYIGETLDAAKFFARYTTIKKLF
jgi:ABC-type multidrug transport system ATPase subunit